MALSNELPVYVETYHYIQAVIDTQKNFPRDVKTHRWSRMDQNCYLIADIHC